MKYIVNNLYKLQYIKCHLSITREVLWYFDFMLLIAQLLPNINSSIYIVAQALNIYHDNSGIIGR